MRDYTKMICQIANFYSSLIWWGVANYLGLFSSNSRPELIPDDLSEIFSNADLHTFKAASCVSTLGTDAQECARRDRRWA